MERVGNPAVSRGVVEQAFAVDGVPGVLWSPEGVDRAPLVLLGHGATLDKRTPYIVSLARRLVRHHGIAGASIDLPGHGERMPPDGVPDILGMWTRPEVMDQSVSEWTAVLGAVEDQGYGGAAGVGYWGLSMGTLLGMPFVVSEPRVQVAVLGLAGAVGPVAARLLADAPEVACPVLMLMQWHDELFTRESVLAVFDALGTRDKRLHVQPGRHSAVPSEEIDASEAFLAAHLLTLTEAR